MSASGRPMLPAAVARTPAASSTCATSAVVVVLPFVPVIAMQRAPSSAAKPISISDTTGTRASRAAATGGADLRQVVAAQLQLYARERAQLGECVAAVRAVGRVARVHSHAFPREQPRGRDAALPQPHDRHDAPAPGRGNHLTFSVASAIAAHSTPRM